jgi:hypothetical protein
VFIALFFVSYIDYLKSVFKSTAVEWDVKTITAGDYSVEVQITKSMWQNFLRDIYNPELMRPKLTQFRDYFNKEMSDRLTRLPDLGFEDDPPERINIALINFAFDNGELINLLKDRGNAIKFEKFDLMRELNKRIEDMKSENLDKFIRPVSAFLTFENEEGLNRCLNYNEAVQDDEEFADFRTLLGEELVIEEASEPTDIIWENRHFTGFDRFKRTLIVVGIVFLLLVGSFVVIFTCSQAATKPLLKYPSINCEEIIES